MACSCKNKNKIVNKNVVNKIQTNTSSNKSRTREQMIQLIREKLAQQKLND
jgi:hypothetical protein